MQGEERAQVQGQLRDESMVVVAFAISQPLCASQGLGQIDLKDKPNAIVSVRIIEQAKLHRPQVRITFAHQATDFVKGSFRVLLF